MTDLWTREGKEQQLYELYEKWADCAACPLSATRTNVVFGQGNPEAKILFCGEAPGHDEDSEGSPFVGKSGQLLRKLVHAAGIDWDDLYVTNIVGCNPVDDKNNNREPRVTERDACLPRVQQIIYIVDPWLIVPVGKFALQSLAKGRNWPITDVRGKLFSSPHPDMKTNGDDNSTEIPGGIAKVFPRRAENKKEHYLEYDMIPILHPAYLLREDEADENKKLKPDGVTMKTLNDLRHIKDYVAELEKAYNVIPTFNRRQA